MSLCLGELIKRLEREPADKVLRLGWSNPHSYRGSYDNVAFEPAENVTVGSMLACAREALGSTYHGWKGGEYEMSEWVDCYLAEVGDCGDAIGERLLNYMLADVAELK